MTLRKTAVWTTVLAMVAVACQQPKESKGTVNTTTETVESGPERMLDYDYTDTVQMGTQNLVYSLHREADDSLGIVVDETGARYVDNFYMLSVACDGQTLFENRFTKGNFASCLGEGFKTYGILDGFRFIEAKDGKLVFGACVSYPESDMLSPFLVTVDVSSGTFTVDKDNVLDVEEMDTDGK